MAKKINELSGMPQMSAAFSGWKNTITVQRITQTVVDGFTQDTASSVTFQGVIQPLDPEQIKLKPEGQRSWEWLDIHIEGSAVIFATNDRFLYNGRKFKIMHKKDYSLNNYVEYHAIEDFQ